MAGESAFYKDTVTLYCRHGSGEDEVWHSKVLVGVGLECTLAANIARTGLADAAAATLYIPERADGYLAPKVWENTPEEELGDEWTLQPGDVFVRGDVGYAIQRTVTELKDRFDDVYSITAVDPYIDGSPLGHWEVTGR